MRGGGILEDGVVEDGADRVGVVLGDLGRQRAGVVVYRVAEDLLFCNKSAKAVTPCAVSSCQVSFAVKTYLLTESLGPNRTTGRMSDGLIAGRWAVEDVAACIGPGVAKGDDPAHRTRPRLLELRVLARRGNDPAQVEDEGDGEGDDDGAA